MGDQPRTSARQLSESPSIAYRAKPIKSTNPRRQGRDPSRS
jgi:hypothetical protein